MENKKKQLDKIMSDFYKRFNVLKEEYEDLVNELVRRLAEKRLEQLKKKM